jgi:TolB-like protein/Tfp pilus assembly protein PilF/tRNA A-37 threonylcarbamoyl transferase component Bud32
MKTSDGLSDSTPRVTGSLAKCEKCGASTRLHPGLCVSCLLGEGLEAVDEVSRAVFESAITEVDVPDKQWRLGDYEILDEIGRGGMGVIYLARQRHPHRIVAVKRVLDYHAGSHQTLGRFRREADAVASLDHPNILPIYEVSESEDGLPFFSMKFATGGSLQKVGPALRAEPRRCVQLMAKVARAVEYAHGRGILHRDLKPGNILLDGRGEPLVSDFGLAKFLDANKDLTKSLTAFGTSGYTAPEQAEGKAADLSPAADVYSLGAILFELLAGRPPFLGSNALAVGRQAAETPAPKLRALARSHDRDLETICARCLERDPKARYQSAGALATDLERWLEGRPIVARPVSLPTRLGRWSRRNPKLIATGAACLLFGAAVMWFFRGELAKMLPAAPEKSIAVLPFENLSDDKEHAFFADGVQDDILTKLAKVADLKVISRTSVMQYRGKRDMRHIGQALGVSHVLEGTVRRSGDNVHINAQLVDTRTDTHIWAEEYHRDLNDVFAIEAELAQSLVNRLRATLSASERFAMQERATKDLVAYDLYIRAKTFITTSAFSTLESESLSEAVHLLNQAIERDRAFALAYYQIAHAHDRLYFLDHNPSRLAMADAAIQSLTRLRPNSGEVHLALAKHLYWGYRDYDRAREEVKLAHKSLPNDPVLFWTLALIDRRQGRWAESTKNFERAIELDPQGLMSLQQLSLSYQYLRRYADAERVLDRAIAVSPKDAALRTSRAYVELLWHADPHLLISTIEAITADDSRESGNFAKPWLEVALCERDLDGARSALAVLPIGGCYDDTVPFPRAWCEGVVAQTGGDDAAARAAFSNARTEAVRLVIERSDFAEALSVLGMADAALGHKEDAIREGRRAVELLPVTKDSFLGAQLVRYLAIIYAWTGEKDLAFQQLAVVASIPGNLSYGELRLHPYWDPLRGDPRFEKLVEEAKRPIALK